MMAWRAAAVVGLTACGSERAPQCEIREDCEVGEVCAANVCEADTEFSGGVTDTSGWDSPEGSGGISDAQPIGAVIDTFCGQPAYQNGADPWHIENEHGQYGYEWQCTEFALRFVCEHYDLCNSKQGKHGNAGEWFTNRYGHPLLAQLTPLGNGDSVAPQAGDVLVLNTGAVGHVAIVKDVTEGFSPNIVKVIEQNCFDCTHAHPLYEDNGHYTVMGAIGWMRPPGPAAECPDLDVTFPDAGDVLTQDATYQVLWGPGVRAPTIKVEVYKSGSLYVQLAAADPNDGRLEFVPTTALFPAGNDYQVCVATVTGSDSACGGLFTIQAATQSWRAHTSGTTNTLWGVWGTGDNDVYAVGIEGTILRYDGVDWAPETSNTNFALFDIWGSGPSDIFAVGDWGTIVHYNGNTWAVQLTGTTNYFYGVWGSAPNDVYAVGLSGAIYHYDGSTWSPMASNTPATLYDVHGSSSSDIWAVGDGGVIMHYNGSVWSEVTTGGQELRAVRSFGSIAYAAGRMATILRFDDTWSQVTPPTTVGFMGLWGTAADDLYVVGADGVYHSPSGTAFMAETLPTSNSRLAVWGDGAGVVYVVGELGTILRYGP